MEEEVKHGAGGGSALEMLRLFASIGVSSVDITFTDAEGAKRGFRRSQSLKDALASMPYLVDSSSRRKINVIVRPHGEDVQLVQLDDLDEDKLSRVRLVAFMTLCTSPGNHQAWVAIAPPAGEDMARRLKRGTGADLTASGATRVPGTANFKTKYAPNFPLVALLDSTPGRTVTAEQLEALGLIAEPEPLPPPRVSPSAHVQAGEGNPRNWKRLTKWPDYDRCLKNAPLAHGTDQPDISRADFTWCKIALDWGFPADAVAARLISLSEKALAEGTGYAERTTKRANSASTGSR